MEASRQTSELIESMLVELCNDFEHWFGVSPLLDHDFAEQGGPELLLLMAEAAQWLDQAGQTPPPEFQQLERWMHATRAT